MADPRDQPWGECELVDCTNPAVTVVVGDAGDFWFCAEHAPPGSARIDGQADG